MKNQDQSGQPTGTAPLVFDQPGGGTWPSASAASGFARTSDTPPLLFSPAPPPLCCPQVVTDNVTGRSKGYGFVRFGTEEERDAALTEMNGEVCMGRALRISVATPKKPGMPGVGLRGKGEATETEGGHNMGVLLAVWVIGTPHCDMSKGWGDVAGAPPPQGQPQGGGGEGAIEVDPANTTVSRDGFPYRASKVHGCETRNVSKPETLKPET